MEGIDLIYALMSGTLLNAEKEIEYMRLEKMEREQILQAYKDIEKQYHEYTERVKILDFSEEVE